MIKYLEKRLDEPSTYVGIGVVLTSLVPIIDGAAKAGSWPERAVIIATGLVGIFKAETGASK